MRLEDTGLHHASNSRRLELLVQYLDGVILRVRLTYELLERHLFRALGG